MTMKLNDLQRMLLSAASQTENRGLNAATQNNSDAATTKSAIASLVRRKLLEQSGTSDVDEVSSYRITDAGLAAIGAVEESLPSFAVSADEPPAPQTKTALVLGLLHRAEGATLDQMVAATNWLPHTTRAALTGLKKKGHDIVSQKADGARTYRIATGQVAV